MKVEDSINSERVGYEDFTEEYERGLKEKHIRRSTKQVGRRLTDVVAEIMEEMKRKGMVQEYGYYEHEGTPDFVVEGDIGIECKNWDPAKKNSLNKTLVKNKILRKFGRKNWRKKILVIPELKFDYKKDRRECEELLKDFTVVDSFPWVTPWNKKEAKETLFPKLQKAISHTPPETVSEGNPPRDKESLNLETGEFPKFEETKDAKEIKEQKELEILDEYKKFLKVDLQLKDSTIKGHIIRARQFLKHLNKDLEALSVEDIRDYLGTLDRLSPSTYSNVVKSLRRFIRDFLKKPELMKTFKLPHIGFQPKTVPTKEQIKRGYHALKTDKQKLIYILYAVTGLRQAELRNLKLSDINLESRCIQAKHSTITKRAFCTFWNDEADVLLRRYLEQHMDEVDENGGKLFNFSWRLLHQMRKLTESGVGIRITPRVLRRWFCSEMLSKGVQEVYVDAFCGRVPKSVLARHYTDFSPERLKEIYDKAELKVLS